MAEWSKAVDLNVQSEAPMWILLETRYLLSSEAQVRTLPLSILFFFLILILTAKAGGDWVSLIS